MSNASFKIKDVEVLSEASGVVTLENATLASSVTFPAGHIIEVKTVSHTTNSGDTFGVAFGTALTMNNILTTEKVIIICGGGYARSANGSYLRATRTNVQVDYDGTTEILKGGQSRRVTGNANETGAPGFCASVWENNTSSIVNTLSIKSYASGDGNTNTYANWNADSTFPITIIAMRCVNA